MLIKPPSAWFGPIQLILDWYYLEDKCKSLLSMALQGRAIRNQVLAQLLPLLWLGTVERALIGRADRFGPQR